MRRLLALMTAPPPCSRDRATTAILRTQFGVGHGPSLVPGEVGLAIDAASGRG